MKFKSKVKFKSVPLFLFLCLSLSKFNRLSESVVPHNAVGQSTTYYYVKPSSNNLCPTESCFTLQQLANNTNKLNNFSIELIFLPGNHDLDLELSIIAINTVSMHSNITNSLSGDTVVINCNNSGKFKFERVIAVSVINLTFIECNGSKAMGVHQFVIEDSSFIGGAALEFNQTSATLVRSTFYDRNCGKKSHYVMNLRNHSQVGGAIVATVRSNITVLDSIFAVQNLVEQYLLISAVISLLLTHLSQKIPSIIMILGMMNMYEMVVKEEVVFCMVIVVFLLQFRVANLQTILRRDTCAVESCLFHATGVQLFPYKQLIPH